jgi:hypothetical protein
MQTDSTLTLTRTLHLYQQALAKGEQLRQELRLREERGINYVYTSRYQLSLRNIEEERNQLQSSKIDSMFDRFASLRIKMANEELRRSAFLAMHCAPSSCVDQVEADLDTTRLYPLPASPNEEENQLDFVNQSGTRLMWS